MTIPSSEAYAEALTARGEMANALGVMRVDEAKPNRNNRRPYKADIRRVAEVELARAADGQIRLVGEADYWRATAKAFRINHESAAESCRAYRAQRNRWRIACLALAVVAVVGWLT